MSKTVSLAQQKAALSFWTHEALAAAKPMPMPVQLGPVAADQAGVAQFEASGPAEFAAAGVAAPDADRAAKEAYPADWAALEAAAATELEGAEVPAEVAGTSGIYTSYTVNQNTALWKIYPHKWVGRLSFSTSSGTSYCSATSISGNVMLTAAHCLYDTVRNVWYRNWVFTPAYRAGSAPYGTFPARTCWILTAYANKSGSYSISGWAPYDVGVCKMGTNSAGQTMNNAVGWMGRMWNFSSTQHLHNLGYPFRDYKDNYLSSAGYYLRLCAAESAGPYTNVLRMGCNWGRGISGGPWMTNYAPFVVSGYADSVNSGLYIGVPNLYGARFNSNNIVPLCNAAGC
jgi:V8-like Glu-specific endopeptidase